ncbi:hypothetical protein ACIP93_22350 [Streptomyces sp. NPDC088745]|uniref:hypothetical protein n=1 Tax=Streptomyces sp. NPDC088745 TaxID=3365884 RepID=UPI0037F74173
MSTAYPDAPDTSEDGSDLGFDWEAERRWSDNMGVLLGVVAGLCVLAVVFAALFLDLAYVVGFSAGAVVLWGGCAWAGRRLRHRWSEEMGVPPAAVPVLSRRLAKERVPQSARARAAMAVLARRAVPNPLMLKWLYPVLIALFLLSAVFRGLDGEWAWMGYWLAMAAVQVAAWISVRRARGRALRVLAELEGPR